MLSAVFLFCLHNKLNIPELRVQAPWQNVASWKRPTFPNNIILLGSNYTYNFIFKNKAFIVCGSRAYKPTPAKLSF